VLGDVVDSRLMSGGERKRTQEALIAFLGRMNERFASELVAPFTITLGDEFEGVLSHAAAGPAIPDLVWEMETSLPEVEVRLGVGCGEIATEISADPRAMDGPVFHRTREALEYAAANDLLGGVFRGFGAEEDAIVSGLARLLFRQRSQWTLKQLRLATLLREGARQVDAAEMLKISKAAVSDATRAAGWETYAEGEWALRKALELTCMRAVPGSSGIEGPAA
jgi:hypothetical protein